MLEIPEARVVARQLSKTVVGKTIRNVAANSSPHKFAWFWGDPAGYPALLNGLKIEAAESFGGFIEMSAGSVKIALGEGASTRYLERDAPQPPKHQLLVEFQDGTGIVCSVQMYGALYAFHAGENTNHYYLAAKEKPSPLYEAFDGQYFRDLLDETRSALPVKAFLATEQRIPGLGNGVLQDILFNARINPRTKLESLSVGQKDGLFDSVKSTIAAMTAQGGRDTEKDLFGNPGGYKTILSSKTFDQPCPACGGAIAREAFLGGKVYFCPNCQPLKND